MYQKVGQSIHNGGGIKIGPDNNMHVPIGELDSHRTKAQNIHNGSEPDGSSSILRITQDGKVAPGNPLGNTDPLNKYYAYGIRNSFGIDFDPVTKSLWDTENGPAWGDEINLVQPGFNSGWAQVQGVWHTGKGLNITHTPRDLVDFAGKGKYRAPEFTWFNTIGPTDNQIPQFR